MTNKINSFWITDKAPVDDLGQIQEYLKPRNQKELLGLFAPEPPTPPDVEEPPKEPQQLDTFDALSDELIELYGLTPEELVLSAMNEPDLWDEDEMAKLDMVLAGELEPSEISDLAREYLEGRKAKSRDLVSPLVSEPLSLDEETDSFLDDEHLEAPMSVSTGEIDLSVPAGSMDVGEWWAKKPSK